MFGSAAQKSGPFSFGSANNNSSANSTSTPSLNFSTNNNASNPTKPSGFTLGGNTGSIGSQSSLFGSNLSSNNVASNGFTSGNNNNATTPSSTGFGFGSKQTTSTVTAPTTASFSFGSKQNGTGTTPLSGVLGANTNKPSLFGNSVTNPSFGSTNIGFGAAQQPQNTPMNQQTTNSSPYGFDINKFSQVEMPKPLTSAASVDENSKLKRKRSDSLETPKENHSLVGRIVDTFRVPTRQSIENVRGLFSSAKTNQDMQLNDHAIQAKSEYQYALSLRSEYRKLTIKKPRSTYANYKEIDPNDVLLSRRKDLRSKFLQQTQNASKVVIDSLTPPSKRMKTQNELANKSTDNDNLTFSKPLSEQMFSSKEGKPEKADDSYYWSNPPIEEISKLSSLELTRVENFCVGRKGFGNVMFKYPVDLTEFQGKWDTLLGKTIIFQNRTLQVYPDEANKPQEDNGLNVPAVVTLEKVFPRKYDIQHPNHELLERHVQRLKSTHGMKFISFDPTSGNYVFEVEHFSIWGIVDEEDDDPEIVAKWKRQQTQESLSEKRKNELQINALEKIAGYGQPGDSWKKQKSDFGLVVPGELKTDEDEIHSENEEELILEEQNDDNDKIPDSLVPATLEKDDQNANNMALLNSNVTDIDQLVEVRAYEPEVDDIDADFLNPRTELATSDNWDEQLKLSNGFFSAFNKNLDQKYNVNLDPKNVGDLIFGKENAADIPKAANVPPVSFENASQYKSCLQEEMVVSAFDVRELDELPRVIVKDEISLKIPMASFENSSNFKIWELLSILYDRGFLESFLTDNLRNTCLNKPSKLSYVLDLKKRELFCDFLQNLEFLDVDTEVEKTNTARNPSERVVNFICQGKISDAIQYAINTKNNHLAVLLTMLDSSDAGVSKLATSQLESWKMSGSLNLIPSGVLKVFKILKGDILSKEYINHLDGLSWPIVLSLMVRYETGSSIKETIRKLVEFAENSGISENPLYQMYFSSLKMIDERKRVETFEVELAFLLMNHLKPLIKYDNAEFDDIVVKFAEKLEKQEMVMEAAFVIEHLTDDRKAKDLLTKLLNGNVTKFGFLEDDSKLHEINQRLRIPLRLLHQARSVEFKNQKQYYKSTVELLVAEDIREAHKLLLAEVAPSVIIGNITSEIKRLRLLIEEFSTLSEFKIGAGVYGDYIDFVDLSNGINYEDEEYGEKQAELKKLYQSILSGMSSLQNYTPKVKIAKTIMIRRLLRVVFKEDLGCDREQVLRLELPESEKNYLEAKFDENLDNRMLTTN